MGAGRYAARESQGETTLKPGRKKIRWTRDMEYALMAGRREHLSFANCARLIGVGYGTVYRKAKELGIT